MGILHHSAGLPAPSQPEDDARKSFRHHTIRLAAKNSHEVERPNLGSYALPRFYGISRGRVCYR